MNFASLFNLAAPDLIVILMVVLLLFGAKKLPNLPRGIGEAIHRFTEARRRWMSGETELEKVDENPMAVFNRLLIPIAIVIFLLACGIWVFGQSD